MVNAVGNLSSYFTNLIDSIMTVERQPLDRLNQQRDSLNVQRGVYNDLKTKMDDLKSALGNLMSGSAFFALTPGRTTTIGNVSSTGARVVDASAGSSAAIGDYQISVTKIAKTQQRVSAVQTSSNKSLDFDAPWSFYLGGTGGPATASVQADPEGRVTTAQAISVGDSYHELDSDTYTVETRLNGSDLQFRLRDSDGNLVAVGPDQSADWQTVTPDENGNLAFDTLRGMKITFNDTGDISKSTTIGYAAMGRKIDVDQNDSLVNIAEKINSAMQPEKGAVIATVIGKQLLLTGQNTGTGHRMVYSSELAAHLGFAADLNNPSLDLQTEQDAQFKVNGLPEVGFFTSKKNSGITDVLSGVTLNLADDSEGKSATISIASNSEDAKTAIDSFITKFNDLQSYLQTETAVTKVDDQNYTRGPLADDSMFSSFRSDMFSIFMEPVTMPGLYKSLNDLGITIDDNLKVTISDSAKLDDAFKNHSSDFQAVIDAVMQKMDDRLSVYSGSSGYLPSAISNIDIQISDIGVDITDLTDRLNDRYNSLTDQYGAIQSQLLQMSYQQQMMSSIYGSISQSG